MNIIYTFVDDRNNYHARTVFIIVQTSGIFACYSWFFTKSLILFVNALLPAQHFLFKSVHG